MRNRELATAMLIFGIAVLLGWLALKYGAFRARISRSLQPAIPAGSEAMRPDQQEAEQ